MIFFRVILLTLIIPTFISCSNKKEFKLKDTNEIKGISDYINKELKIEKDFFLNGKKISLIYLILKECNCVYENIDFVKEYLNEKKDNLILVIKPDSKGQYVKEMIELSLLPDSNFRLVIDEKDDFLSYGNFYISDKFFLIENYKLMYKIELKKSNFSKIKKF